MYNIITINNSNKITALKLRAVWKNYNNNHFEYLEEY